MDFRHLIVTCLFSMLRLSFETQKIKENYAIFFFKSEFFSIYLPFITTKTVATAMIKDFIAIKTVVVTHEPGSSQLQRRSSW